MAATCLYVFLILLLAQVITQQDIVYVSTVDNISHSSHDLLEHYLCIDTVSSTLSNTTLLLSTTGTHTLHQSWVDNSQQQLQKCHNKLHYLTRRCCVL